MAKKKQLAAESATRFDLGQELLASVREMKANVRGRTHQPVVSEVV